MLDSLLHIKVYIIMSVYACLLGKPECRFFSTDCWK